MFLNAVIPALWMALAAFIVQLFATDWVGGALSKAFIAGLCTLVISTLINLGLILLIQPTFTTFDDSGQALTWGVSFVIFFVASFIGFFSKYDDWQGGKVGLSIVLVVILLIVNIGREASLPPSAWFTSSGAWGCDTNGKAEMINLLHVQNATNLPNTDLHTLILRTSDSAIKAAGQQMPSKYSSYLAPNNAYLQQVDKQWVYVVDLKVTDTQGFNSRGAYSPGYFTVSATDPEAVAIFHDGYKIRYLPGVFGLGTNAQDVERHVYFDYELDHPEYKVLDLTGGLELEDDGTPHYTATLAQATVGTTGYAVVGMIVIDVVNGNITPYSLKTIPSWVDRVYPEDYMVELANDYWAPYHANNPCQHQGNAGKVQQDSENFQAISSPEGGVRGEIVYSYTSVNSDTTMIGQLVMNLQTGQTYNYDLSNNAVKFSNVTEAKTQIESNIPIQNGQKRTAEQCGLYQVLGDPTIICALYNSSGSYAGIAMYKARYAAASDTTKVIVSDNIDDAYSQIAQQTATEQQTGNGNVPASTVNIHQYTGTIARISQAFTLTTTSYIDFNLLAGATDDQNKVISTDLTFEVKYSGQARLLCSGDKVTITGTTAPGSNIVSVTQIDDPAISKSTCSK